MLSEDKLSHLLSPTDPECDAHASKLASFASRLDLLLILTLLRRSRLLGYIASAWVGKGHY